MGQSKLGLETCETDTGIGWIFSKETQFYDSFILLNSMRITCNITMNTYCKVNVLKKSTAFLFMFPIENAGYQGCNSQTAFQK